MTERGEALLLDGGVRWCDDVTSVSVATIVVDYKGEQQLGGLKKDERHGEYE